MNYNNRMYFDSKAKYTQGKPQPNRNSKAADKSPSRSFCLCVEWLFSLTHFQVPYLFKEKIMQEPDMYQRVWQTARQTHILLSPVAKPQFVAEPNANLTSVILAGPETDHNYYCDFTFRFAYSAFPPESPMPFVLWNCIFKQLLELTRGDWQKYSSPFSSDFKLKQDHEAA